MATQPDDVPDRIPPHIHAMMADDQAEILRLRTELAAVTVERDEFKRLAFEAS
jgi:hypothetical protein